MIRRVQSTLRRVSGLSARGIGSAGTGGLEKGITHHLSCGLPDISADVQGLQLEWHGLAGVECIDESFASSGAWGIEV